MLAGRGHHVTIATMTPGDCGSHEMGAEEIAELRRQEAAAAAALIGAAYLCVEFRDMAVFNDDASRRAVTELLRHARPDLVLTASPLDYHCDHEAASALVRDACFAAPAPNYATRAKHPAPPLRAIPHLYWMDAVEGRDREGRALNPDIIVNVTAAFPRKREMLAMHASQRDWLRRHHGTDDYLADMELWTRARGELAGFPYGEGFRHYLGHPYPRTPLLEELLGAGCFTAFPAAESPARR
jgi:LmbE family N-acetylglucosaminyl deacetylase